jgi:hypothetical protein
VTQALQKIQLWAATRWSALPFQNARIGGIARPAQLPDWSRSAALVLPDGAVAPQNGTGQPPSLGPRVPRPLVQFGLHPVRAGSTTLTVQWLASGYARLALQRTRRLQSSGTRSPGHRLPAGTTPRRE